MKDKHGIEIQWNDQVVVPEPNRDDSYLHSFIGNATDFDDLHNFVIVEDQDSDFYSIESHRLMVVRQQD